MIKKRLFSLLLILSLIFSLSVAAYGETDRFVFDETGQITGEELQTLDNLGARISPIPGRRSVSACPMKQARISTALPNGSGRTASARTTGSCWCTIPRRA